MLIIKVIIKCKRLNVCIKNMQEQQSNHKEFIIKKHGSKINKKYLKGKRYNDWQKKLLKYIKMI